MSPSNARSPEPVPDMNAAVVPAEFTGLNRRARRDAARKARRGGGQFAGGRGFTAAARRIAKVKAELADAERAQADAENRLAALQRQRSNLDHSITAKRRLLHLVENLTEDEAAQLVPIMGQLMDRMTQIAGGVPLTPDDLLLPLRMRPDQHWSMTHLCGLYGATSSNAALFVGPLVRSGLLIRVSSGVYRLGAAALVPAAEPPPLRIRLLHVVRHEADGAGLTAGEIRQHLPDVPYEVLIRMLGDMRRRHQLVRDDQGRYRFHGGRFPRVPAPPGRFGHPPADVVVGDAEDRGSS